jgi:possible transglycosylase
MATLPLQSGIQGIVRGTDFHPEKASVQKFAGADFRNILAETAKGGSTGEVNSIRSGAALPKRALQYEAIFDEASRTYGVSKSLLLAVAKQESNFDPNSVSHAGAQGIMQLMPGTAKTLGVKNAFDPYENIMGGAKLLRDNIRSFGSVPLALAAYNAGPGAVKKYGGVPPYKETQDYVKKIMADLGNKSYSTSNYSYRGLGENNAYGSALGSEINGAGLSGDSFSSDNSSLLSLLGSSGNNSLLLSGMLQSLLTGALLKGKQKEGAAGDGDDTTVTLDKQSFQSLVSLLQMQMMMPSRIGEIGES